MSDRRKASLAVMVGHAWALLIAFSCCNALPVEPGESTPGDASTAPDEPLSGDASGADVDRYPHDTREAVDAGGFQDAWAADVPGVVAWPGECGLWRVEGVPVEFPPTDEPIYTDDPYGRGTSITIDGRGCANVAIEEASIEGSVGPGAFFLGDEERRGIDPGSDQVSIQFVPGSTPGTTVALLNVVLTNGGGFSAELGVRTWRRD